jgi:hypothetical protein
MILVLRLKINAVRGAIVGILDSKVYIVDSGDTEVEAMPQESWDNRELFREDFIAAYTRIRRDATSQNGVASESMRDDGDLLELGSKCVNMISKVVRKKRH